MPVDDPNILSDVAAELTLKVIQRSNWLRRFHIKNKRTRSLESLTGSTFIGQIRDIDGTLIKSFTFAVIAGSPPVYFDVSLTIADINGLTVGVIYYFDWFRIVASIPKKIAKGTITAEPSQTIIP